ncbi:MAG: hypothetical protein QXG40_08160, partial [Ignisphaera sp.]
PPYLDFMQFYNLSPSVRIEDFFAKPRDLGIAGYRHNEYLVCFRGDELSPMTSSKDPFILINFYKRLITTVE